MTFDVNLKQIGCRVLGVRFEIAILGIGAPSAPIESKILPIDIVPENRLNTIKK